MDSVRAAERAIPNDKRQTTGTAKLSGVYRGMGARNQNTSVSCDIGFSQP